MFNHFPEFDQFAGEQKKRNSILPMTRSSLYSSTPRDKNGPPSRNISTSPFKILDAPGIIDDYYLNVLEWKGNNVYIALKDIVYCYNIETKDVTEIYMADENAYISSLRATDNNIAIGESNGKINLYDTEKQSISESYTIHGSRTCTLAFKQNILSSGDKEGFIKNVDLRSLNKISTFEGHRTEICSLRWNPINSNLANGGNDNKIKIWRIGYPMHETLSGHTAGVKALDWCPWKYNILCSGGGIKDRTIRFWNVPTGKEVKKVVTDSQICTLHYLSQNRELVTSHGFSTNDLKLWDCSNGIKFTKSFGNHESRILHTVVSPDQCTLLSLSPDESLKFWKLNNPPKAVLKRDSIQIR